MTCSRAAVCGSLVAAALLVAASALAGASSISAIVADPEAYSGLEVTVVGTVTAPSLEHTDETLYGLLDGDRRITVVGRGAAPAVGDRVQVTARVGWKQPDEEFTWPPVLFEVSREPAP